MLPIRKILHPTDFSEYSEAAFRLACALARDYGAPLVVLHVSSPLVVAYGEGVFALPPPLPVPDLDDYLVRLRPASEGVTIDPRFVEGDPAAEIVRFAAEELCDLIVLGTHGRTGLRRLLMGSVAEHVVRKAPCPVLTVKAPAVAGKETESTARGIRASESPAHAP
jgi:nucleotide-binding universal stress UspA family protein